MDTRKGRGKSARSGLAADAVTVAVEVVGVRWKDPDVADVRGYPVHKALLAKGIVVLERIDLAGVPPGEHELVVLPLLIPASDGAPARAILVSDV